MFHGVRKLGLLSLLWLLTPAGWAGEIIAHDTVQLSIAEVRDVYLGERQLLGSVRLVAVNNASMYSEFLATVLQTNPRQYAARWTRKSFREGLVPPDMKGGDAEVIAFVKATPGAVGYVRSGAGSGAKVLDSF